MIEGLTGGRSGMYFAVITQNLVACRRRASSFTLRCSSNGIEDRIDDV
jgi:hypothetical protein